MTKPSYDTQEGIEGYLKRGLEGLRELSRIRSEAGYQRRERMGWWVVASYFVFDECGNTMIITEGRPDYYTFGAYPPKVFDREYYETNAKDRDRGMSCTFGGGIPDPNAVCPQCLEGWTVENAHNYKTFPYDDDLQPHHKDCWKLRAVEEHTEWFKELLDQAIHYDRLVPIPNGYSSSYDRPWFIVHTSSGPIKIGWRKRVISIHWDKAEGLADKDGNKLFENESTTKANKMVHAWGKDKAIEYLKKLMPHALDQLEKAL